MLTPADPSHLPPGPVSPGTGSEHCIPGGEGWFCPEGGFTGKDLRGEQFSGPGSLRTPPRQTLHADLSMALPCQNRSRTPRPKPHTKSLQARLIQRHLSATYVRVHGDLGSSSCPPSSPKQEPRPLATACVDNGQALLLLEVKTVP